MGPPKYANKIVRQTGAEWSLLPAYYVAQAAAAAREQLHGNKEAAPSPGQLQPPGPAQMSLTL